VELSTEETQTDKKREANKEIQVRSVAVEIEI